MLGNYFTLLHISRLIHQRCVGHTISEIYSQQKQQLCVVVEAAPLQTIVISCEPSQNYLYIREGNFRARKNSVDLLPEAIGKAIRNVACAPDDRRVLISLDNGLSLECEMFGSRANVGLWKTEKEAEGTVQVLEDSFLKKKEIDGRRAMKDDPLHRPPYLRLMQDEDLFGRTIRAHGDDDVSHALKKSLPSLGPTLSREVMLRAGISTPSPAASVADAELRKIFTEMSKVVMTLTALKADAEARIYYEGDLPVCVSPIALRTYEGLREEKFPDIGTAIQRYVGRRHSVSSFGNAKEKIFTWLEKEEKKADQTREKIAVDLAESQRGAEYERNGRLIMAHIHELRKGLNSASLENVLSTDESKSHIAVQLDASLSPAANAERYFEKAKRAKITREESEERVRSLEGRLAVLRSLKDDLADVSSPDSLREFARSNDKELHRLGFMTTKEKDELPPFRIFTVEGGFQVLAGKSSENNDMLTVNYAKPNDLWFHCRGSSGSHVVLKVNSAPGDPSKKAIHQAASIAAYYSKMKNASSVPVAMAEKKFVRKPKGVPAGTVILEREKILFVEPKLPPSLRTE
ncbi:MAG TPA: NFACT RNA binding domain-containing protein [Bacteroidota bacterium]|nr:NFACT RNA binding domain-containing protein [Bacteroidota bacterium]